jgi:hypothetical protein
LFLSDVTLGGIVKAAQLSDDDDDNNDADDGWDFSRRGASFGRGDWGPLSPVFFGGGGRFGRVFCEPSLMLASTLFICNACLIVSSRF